MPPRAVLFDFDGVIADSENVHVAAWERTFLVMGMEVAPEVCAQSAELDDRVFLAEVFERRGIDDADIEGWVRRKQRLALEMLTDWPRVYPGFARLVERLKGRVRLGVVSGTWRENVEIVLRASGLADAFELIVGKEDFAAPKPEPESYLVALRRLGLKANEVVALEDSPGGVQAARGAGIKVVVAVGHRRPEGEWSRKAVFLPDLRDGDAVIEAIGMNA